ncbi:hypothetical protein BDR26DRAFT_873637 [Obelidium mucronatum]|nr:hypothetical protein BDR26DRAFT_873637 [Obelidium mucronatum]
MRRLFDAPPPPPSAAKAAGLFGYTRAASWSAAASETVLSAQRNDSNSNSSRPLPLTKAVKMLDALSDQLCAVLDATELVLNVHPEKRVVDDAAQGNALLTSYMNSLNTNVALYNALKASIDAANYIPQPKPSTQTTTVANLLMKDFQKSGIHLGGYERAEFVRLSDDILSLGNKFSRNSSTPSCESIEIEQASTRLAGIHPQLLNRLVAGHRSDIATISMDNSGIVSHILQYTRDAAVRKAVYIAANTASEEDVYTLESLLRKRMQLAKVLGKKSYSEMWLADKMAGSSTNVMRFLESVSKGNRALANADAQRLESIKAVFNSKANGGSGTIRNPQLDSIQAWDESFYKQFLVPPSEEGVTLISGDELRPYFSVGTTMQGINDLLKDLYGIWLEPVTNLNSNEIWHPDVRKVQVMHETEGIIGIVYMDLFAREKGVEVDKFEGAAQFTVRCSRRLDDYQEYCGEPRSGIRSPDTEIVKIAPDGTRAIYQLPIVVLVTQFERPPRTATEPPTLLTLRRTISIYRERRCALDFVEVPSNLLESFARDEKMIQGVKARHGLLEALDRQKQVKMAVLDQLYHSGMLIHSQFHVIPYVEGTQWQTQFSHLFSYGSSYYSYFWARRVSDSIRAKVFGAHHSAAKPHLLGKDELREGGEIVKDELLKWGGARDPWIGLEKMGIDVTVLGSMG